MYRCRANYPVDSTKEKMENPAEYHLDVFNITELIQMAIGENPSHRISEEMNQVVKNFIQTVSANPELLKKKYRLENGKLAEC